MWRNNINVFATKRDEATYHFEKMSHHYSIISVQLLTRRIFWCIYCSGHSTHQHPPSAFHKFYFLRQSPHSGTNSGKFKTTSGIAALDKLRLRYFSVASVYGTVMLALSPIIYVISIVISRSTFEQIPFWWH